MPRCPLCEMTYVRNEHLERHVATHIPGHEKYRCEICNVGHKRKEQLKRHQDKLHPMLLAASLPNGNARSHQRRIACVTCASAKAKCSKQIPKCQRCIVKNIDCQPRVAKRATDGPSRAQVSENMRNIHNRLMSQGINRERAMQFSNHDTSLSPSNPGYQWGQEYFGHPPMGSQLPSTYPGAPPSPPHSLSPNYPYLVGPGGHHVDFNNYDYSIKQEYDGPMQMNQTNFAPIGTGQKGMMPIDDTNIVQPYQMVSHPLEPQNLHIELSYGEYSDDMNSVMSPNGWLPSERDSPFSVSSPLDHSTPQLSNSNSSPASFTMAAPQGHWSATLPIGSLNNHAQPIPESSPLTIGQSPWVLCNAIGSSDVYNEIPTSKYMRLLTAALRTCQVQSDWQPRILQLSKLTTSCVSEFDEGTRMKLSHFCHRIAHQNQQPKSSHSFGWNDVHQTSSSRKDATFMQLPASHMLDKFMQGYSGQFEQFYPILPSSALSPADLLRVGSDTGSLHVLLLLTIAGGAVATKCPDWSGLVNGLVECCRVGFFVAGSRDMVASDITRLRAALLFLNLGAWSGEKEHTDFVLSQRQSYMDMLRRSGLLQQRPQDSDAPIDRDGEFQRWQKREATHRLVYSWALVDQELGLFGDWKSSLDLNQLKLPMPCSDDVWQAVSADNLANIPPQSRFATPSLYSLYQQLLQRPDEVASHCLTPLHLRLLLHPLQNQICTLVSCLNNKRATAPQQTQTHLGQLQTAQKHLRKWYDFMQQCIHSVSEATPFMYANLVMYHLISLNSMIYFPDVEELARGEMTPAVYLQTFWVQGRFTVEAPKVFWHCGAVSRLFRQFSELDRPRWLPAALYRVAVTMWAASLINGTTQPPVVNTFLPSTPNIFAFAIDRYQPMLLNNPMFEPYWHHHEGQQISIPALYVEKTASWVSLANSPDILTYCAHLVKEYDGEGMLSDRIYHELTTLAQKAIRL